MENQDCYIPEHLRERWEEISRKLGEASIDLVVASQAYNQAVLARLAISQELKDWQMQEYFNK